MRWTRLSSGKDSIPRVPIRIKGLNHPHTTGSREHVHAQRLVSVTTLYTTEEQRSVVHFMYAKGLNTKDIHKEMCPVYSGKCFSRKAIRNWADKFSQGR
jgi:hypothetical protein